MENEIDDIYPEAEYEPGEQVKKAKQKGAASSEKIVKNILAVSGNGLVIRCPRCGSERASGNIDALNEEGHFMCQECQYTGFWRYFRFSRYRICA